LIAKDVSFRVHRSLLSKASPIFQNMFSIPQPQHLETWCDCPVVRLPDDPKELEVMLAIIYYGIHFPKRNAFPTWYTVHAMATIGHKYMYDTCVREAIAALKLTFPTTIEALDALYYDKSRSIEIDNSRDCISVVNLARKLGLKEIYAQGLYDCCQLSLEMLAGGLPAPNGVLEYLSVDDLSRCRKVFTTHCLEQWDRSVRLNLFIDPAKVPQPCISSYNGNPRCPAQSDLMRGRCQNELLRSSSKDPLGSKDEEIAKICAANWICSGCTQHFQRCDRQARQAMLNKLPAIFMLQ